MTLSSKNFESLKIDGFSIALFVEAADYEANLFFDNTLNVEFSRRGYIEEE